MAPAVFSGVQREPAVFRQLISSTAVVAVATALVMFSGTRVTAAEYAIDPARTVVSFEVRNAGFSVQRGRLHGAIGTVGLDPKAGSGWIDIVVDARSIETGSKVMESFLRGKGLLNVEQYPEISYKAERVVFAYGEPQRIEGELTLLGVTRPVPLTVSEYACTPRVLLVRQRCMIDANATFKRSEFGMTRYTTFNSDEVKLAIRAEGVWPPTLDYQSARTQRLP